ncbi:SEC-C metal-binding domain-containing protein [Desulforhopalus singaporensis]|uniref:SEC-C motif-containing protein n=1 Tax=Desulforhopalus singaporensis TaxID=91360 RepID=A0A1H0MGC8_9BACT|nr:SEC-C metal-binding domain-containing protein [Desulforhopalus singaporensis]SDO79488.1 SEC-C motif-containing protein [Desulforhopalus singaporensis]
MVKIGRNEKCPCQSGKKYKYCCGRKNQRAAPANSSGQNMKVTLMDGVKRIQEDALAKEPMCRELGVFFFFATAAGDAWMMEMTARDCVQLADNGELLEPPIDENSETIEINWSHVYEVKNKEVVLTAYADKTKGVLADAPSRELSAATRRMLKRFSQEQLAQLHLPAPADQRN